MTSLLTRDINNTKIAWWQKHYLWMMSPMFEENASNRRHACIQIKRDPSEDFVQYIGTLNQFYESFTLLIADPNYFKYVIFAKGLHEPQNANIQFHVLERLEIK
uniref:DUF4286 family protein n=1 Tax=Heterorhabditis bacteriophora TaxID=37862 RepID=A0A1I7X7J7_HETBA